MQALARETATQAGLTLGGPALIGLIAGLSSGPAVAASTGAETAVLVLGVGLALVPALYIISTLVGVAPEAARFWRAVRSGLCAAGLAMLGLAPAVGFLVATTASETVRWFFAGAALFVGAFVGLRALYCALFESAPFGRAGLAFAAWAAITLWIGANLFVQVVGV